MRPLLTTTKISLMPALMFSHLLTICAARFHPHVIGNTDNLGVGVRAVLEFIDPKNPPPILPVSHLIADSIGLSVTNHPKLAQTASPCAGKACATAPPTAIEYTCSSARLDLSKAKDSGGFEVICNIDFPGQNIYPFILAESFKECFAHCQQHNAGSSESRCAGFVYAPERAMGADNCYLKSSLNEPGLATIHLIGATASTPIPTTSPPVVVAAPAVAPQIADTSTLDRQARKISIKEVKELGTSTNKPTNKYVNHDNTYQPLHLSADLTVPGVNVDLIQNYGMAPDTGIWNGNDFVIKADLKMIKSIPQMARDGGKGGVVNGTNIFLFCDTVVFSDGSFVDFVSSSVATDEDMNGLQDKALTLVDHIGQWQDDVGRMRGFAQMTKGEEAYNKAVSGDGFRYAVWPEAAPIPVNHSTSLIYASLVYDEVDMENQNNYNLTYFGNTLLQTKVDPQFGPYADRIMPQMFGALQITYGSLAGIRAWGKDGIGGNDGYILLFGKNSDPNHPGIFAAKTTPDTFTDFSKYQFWDGSGWGKTVALQGHSEGSFLNISVVDLDILYLPKSSTFLMIYTTYPPDNKFYFRELLPHPGTTEGTFPPYTGFGYSDVNYADTIMTGKWASEGAVLYEVHPEVAMMYASGVHAGYFGEEDVTNGGDSILLSWTEQTGKSGAEGYAHKVARARITYDGKVPEGSSWSG
jgi:hypothetical protein